MRDRILMKIKTVELSWFRGAAHSTTLDTSLKSVVVYGPNGSGKSTFPDSFEYLYRNGSIKHLSHEYSGKKQEKGVRNTHARDNVSKLIFSFDENNIVNIIINRDGTHEFNFTPDSFRELIEKCEADRFILRQDEVANFINSSKSEKYSVLLPLLGLENYETVSENFKNLKKVIIEESELQKNQQKHNGLLELANRLLPSLNDSDIQDVLKGLSRRYLNIMPCEREQLVEKLFLSIEEKTKKVTTEIKICEILKQIDRENIVEKLAQVIVKQEKASHDIDELLGHKIEVLEKSSSFSAKLGDYEKIDCPSCGREILKSEYISHVETELKQLMGVKETYQKAKQTRKIFSDSLKQILQKVEDEDILKWIDLDPQKELKVSLNILSDLRLDETQESFAQEKIKLIQPNVKIIDKFIKKEVEKTCPTVEELIKDRDTIEIVKLLPEINLLQKRLDGITGILESLEETETRIRQKLKDKTEKVIDQISSGVRDMWSTLHPGEPIEDIRLIIPDSSDTAIDVCLKFHGVEQPSPRLTLSEGYRNSLGLCIFLTLAKVSEDQDQPIILDDIITSLDREHRGFVAELLRNNFSNRQILLFTHDREWFSELRHMLPNSNWELLMLKPWESPEIGLQWEHRISGFERAKDLIPSDLSSAGNKTRSIMDTDLSLIAEKLHIRMVYAKGDKNDYRYAVEFLERITSEAENDGKFRKKEGDSYVDVPEAISDWKTTKSLLIPWANRASHGGEITKSEVERLIEMCEKSLAYFKCGGCSDFIWASNQESRKRLQCSCGKLQWRYG